MRVFDPAGMKIGPGQGCGKHRECKHYAANNDCNVRRHPVFPRRYGASVGPAVAHGIDVDQDALQQFRRSPLSRNFFAR
jgi:hypothetical protein